MSEHTHSGWSKAWDTNQTGWHETNVNGFIKKYSSSFLQDGKEMKVFVPLCGKTVDMKWFADQGHSVVGLDCVAKPLEDFCKDHDLKWSEEAAPDLGDESRVLKVNDCNIHLYQGDILQFKQLIEGHFDCIWDRGSLVALNRKDIKRYVEIIKEVLKPGGRILTEIFEYDVAIFEGSDAKHPPPFAMQEEELKTLYEPDCKIEFLERVAGEMSGQEIKLAYYLITKH